MNSRIKYKELKLKVWTSAVHFKEEKHLMELKKPSHFRGEFIADFLLKVQSLRRLKSIWKFTTKVDNGEI